MFWGLIMEPKRRYTQKVKHPFHISMAALDIFSADDEPTQLMLHFDDRNYLLCTLQKGQMVQCPLDLNFEAGDEVVFATNGHSNIHLSGYLQDDSDQYLEEQDEEEEEEEDNEVKVETKNKKRKIEKSEDQSSYKKSKLAKLLDETYDSDDDDSFAPPEEESDEEDDLEEEEDDDDEDAEEEEEDDDDDESDEDVSSLSENEEQNIKPKLNGVARKKKNKANVTEIEQNEQKSPMNKPPKSPKQRAQSVDSSQKSQKTPKGDKNKVVQTPASEGKAGSNQKRVEGGVIIQDLKVGDGPVVKPGKMVQVYYEGRLKQNNKVFDHNTKGSGFKFRLGKQEVIKGWDVGLNGMKIGGKRRITCPPNMAYGNKGSPPVIPANSTLVFDVELKNIL